MYCIFFRNESTCTSELCFMLFLFSLEMKVFLHCFVFSSDFKKYCIVFFSPEIRLWFIFSEMKVIQERNVERIAMQKDHQKTIENLRKEHKKELDVCG